MTNTRNLSNHTLISINMFSNTLFDFPFILTLIICLVFIYIFKEKLPDPGLRWIKRGYWFENETEIEQRIQQEQGGHRYAKPEESKIFTYLMIAMILSSTVSWFFSPKSDEITKRTPKKIEKISKKLFEDTNNGKMVNKFV